MLIKYRSVRTCRYCWVEERADESLFISGLPVACCKRNGGRAVTGRRRSKMTCGRHVWKRCAGFPGSTMSMVQQSAGAKSIIRHDYQLARTLPVRPTVKYGVLMQDTNHPGFPYRAHRREWRVWNQAMILFSFHSIVIPREYVAVAIRQSRWCCRGRRWSGVDWPVAAKDVLWIWNWIESDTFIEVHWAMCSGLWALGLYCKLSKSELWPLIALFEPTPSGSADVPARLERILQWPYWKEGNLGTRTEYLWFWYCMCSPLVDKLHGY